MKLYEHRLEDLRSSSLNPLLPLSERKKELKSHAELTFVKGYEPIKEKKQKELLANVLS